MVGYKANAFEYLRDKFGVDIVYNEDYNRYNNTSSMIRVIDRLADTFVCSSDNYFTENVFLMIQNTVTTARYMPQASLKNIV